MHNRITEHALRLILLVVTLITAGPTRAQVKTAADARRVLGVEDGIHPLDLKARRNQLLKQNHPDIAGERSREFAAHVNVAYDLLVEENESKSNRRDRVNQTAPKSTAPGAGWDRFNGLDDFTLNEMLQRTGAYAKFFATLPALAEATSRTGGNPFLTYAYKPIDRRLDEFARMAKPLRVVIVAMAAAPYVTDYADWLFSVGAVGVLELSTQVRAAMGRHWSGVAARALMQRFDRVGPVHGGSNLIRRQKAALLSYDLAEALALRNLRPELGETLYFRRVLAIAKLFEGAELGLLLRVHSSVGPAANWRRQMRDEVRMRPGLWLRRVRSIEARGVELTELRRDLDIDAGLLAHVLAPVARAENWAGRCTDLLLRRKPRL